MKNIFEINNNERERILEMHTNATKKLYLMEQEQIPTIEQIESTLKIPLIVDDKRKKIRIYGDVEKIFVKSALLNSMNDTTQAQEFNRLLRDIERGPNEDVTQENINYYSSVVYELINKFIETWKNTLNTGQQINVNFYKTKSNLPETETSIPKGYRIELDWNPQTNVDLYVNNKWELKTPFKDEFKNKILIPISAATDTYPGIQFRLLELRVETSASRYRNTGEAQDLTFAQLSGYRNSETTNFIKESLTAFGVKGIDNNKITQNYLAPKSETNPRGNGDGSSGPNPPEPNQYVDGGQVPMSQKPTEPRNQFGDPHQTPEEYDQYKFLRVKILLDANLTQVDPAKKTNTIVDYKWDIGYGTQPKITTTTVKPKMKIPKLTLDLSRLLKIKPEKCAAYF
jgi:hypothetical protein